MFLVLFWPAAILPKRVRAGASAVAARCADVVIVASLVW